MSLTQIEAARQGKLTDEMMAVSQKESMEPEVLRSLVAEGKIVIPANKRRSNLSVEGIGQCLRTKINVNLGVSNDCADYETELEKARLACRMKAEAIMDLSCCGKTQEFRQKLLATTSAMVGTVPIYDAVGLLDKELKDITPDEFLQVVECHARDGVDFMTIHAGMTRHTAERIKKNARLTNIVSRGGSLLYAWMQINNAENPFYEHFDKLLDILRQYDVTLSLGDACRPGSINDATDAIQIEELIILGELTKRAWEKGVQVIIEGPGHMALNEIKANVLLEKKLCHGAPFYVLGPIVTDIAPGYDHITSAIGGAIAAASGADFLCYVTPAEHLRLPTVDDVREGIIASKIAAHAGDIAKGIKNARDIDNEMSRARMNIDFEKMFSLAIDEEKARSYRTDKAPEDRCTMCGKMCAVRTMNKVMKGEELNLYV